MMKFDELAPRDQRYINGKIAQFMDAYIRQNQVWTPDQMLHAFSKKMTADVSSGLFNRESDYQSIVWTSEEADTFLTTTEGKEIALMRMAKKYQKDTAVARADAPIVERVRFGHKWDSNAFFDISYGLKNRHDFTVTEELQKYPFQSWTVNHVNDKLKLYSKTLLDVLPLLSTSPIEISFYEYWLKTYYQDEAPALIPEVCGFRSSFYYYERHGRVYATCAEAGVDGGDTSDIKPTNFRFDFFVSNTRKAKAYMIELDGHEYHKTKEQRIVDSIKRNTVAKFKIPALASHRRGTDGTLKPWPLENTGVLEAPVCGSGTACVGI